MTDPLPGVLDAAALPLPALRAAVLDGELYPIGEGFRSVDLPPEAAARAGSLASLAGRARVLADETAAWVWAARPSPGPVYRLAIPHTAAVAHAETAAGLGVRMRAFRPRPGDVAEPGGVPTTTPRRTAIDLLRRAAGPEDPWEPDTVRALLALARLDPAGILAELAGPVRLAGRRLAIERAQVLVTR